MAFSLVRRHCIALGLVLGTAGVLPLHTAAAPTNSKLPATVLVVGDSLSAEYGLKRGTGWVALMEQRMAQEKVAARVINASISGDTTSGGRSRLPALLKQHAPTLVIIELGGNDALRGLPLQSTQDNLLTMTQAAQAAGARVLLVGMQIPPNYGQDYSKRFADTFANVAKAHKAELVPFMLQGVADGPNPLQMFQSDRIHPTEAAHPIILNNIWPVLKKML
jgi:acyl-CoA thioesterase I